MMLDLPASHWLCRQLPLLLSEALKDRIHSVVARIFTKTADISFAIQDSLATALGDTETAIRRNSCYITISDEEQLQMVLTKKKKGRLLRLHGHTRSSSKQFEYESRGRSRAKCR